MQRSAAGFSLGSLIQASRSLAIAFPVVALISCASHALCGTPPLVEWARQFGGLGSANETGFFIAADGGGNTYVVGTTNGALPGQTSAGLNDAYLRKYDSSGSEIWSRQFGTTSNDYGIGVAVDPSGGVYAAGRTEGVLGSASVGGSDAYVRKYDASGNLLWTRQFGTAVFDSATSVAADSTGVYVTGRTDAALPGQTFLGVSDAYVRKYDLSGTELWTRQFGSAFYENPTIIFVDSSGVYAGGQTEGVVQDPATPQTNAGVGDAFIQKYSLTGVYQWSRTFGTTGSDILFGIAADSTNIYVAGQAAGALPGQTAVGPPGDSDAFLRKYSRDGTEVWTRQFGTIQSDAALTAFADSTGVYVAGFVSGAMPGQSFAGINDAFLQKYDANGTLLWTNEFGSTLADQVNGVTGDATGVYVAGNTNGVLPGQTSGGNTDAFVRKYAPGGTVVWTRQFGYPGPAVDQANAIASDGHGNTYAAGTTNGALPGQTSLGVNDAFLRKHDGNGTILWTRQFGTPAGDAAFAVAADETGAYVAGNTSGTLPGQTSAGLTDAYIQKYDKDGNVLWTSQFGTSASETVNGIALDDSGVYVAGQTLGALPGQTTLGNVDAFVRKYSKDGAVLWTSQFGSSNIDMALAVATGGGGVYVSGITRGAFPGQTFAGVGDAFLRKFDAAGAVLWTRQFGTAVYDEARGVAADATGVYVTGRTDGVLDDPVLTLTNQGFSDFYIRKYSHTGTHIWTREFGSPGQDNANSLATDGSGVIMTGSPQGAVTGQTFAGGLTDAFVRKYDQSGNEVWSFPIATPFNDNARGIASDQFGVYIAGDTQGSVFGQASSGDVDAIVVKLAACDTTYTGNIRGNLNIPSGRVCLSGATVRGNVTQTGGSLLTVKSTVRGNVTVRNGNAAFSIGPGTLIGGSLRVHDLPAGGQNKICGVNVHGDLQYHDARAGALIGSPSASCAGNTIGGNLRVNNNAGPMQVYSNAVGNNLHCQNNTSITGGGNTAKGKQGQCASF